MNSREWETEMDTLFRLALQPYREAEPSENVWRRVLNAVRLAPPSRWQKALSWLHGLSVLSLPSSSQPFCVEPFGQCLPAPYIGVMALQLLDMRSVS